MMPLAYSGPQSQDKFSIKMSYLCYTNKAGEKSKEEIGFPTLICGKVAAERIYEV